MVRQTSIQAYYARVAFRNGPLHLVCMKRTNLVLDEDLLEEALRLSGERTYSATVERALQEFVRRAKTNRVFDLGGSGLWEGDLSEMRGDETRGRRRGRAAG